MSPSMLFKSVFTVYIFYGNILPGDSFERFENVVKPPMDRREYRGLKLSNEMKVMLISDRFTESSAASLTVGVGAFNDHRSVPGLTNLVGHVLLTGGGENPSHFERFIQSLHGSVVAPNTREVDQSFTFSVPRVHLATALKEFAQIFVNPRLLHEPDPNLLRKAVQSVQREFSKNAEDDDERIAEVEKRFSADSYFINHLYCGSKDSLYEHIRKGDKKKSENEENTALLKVVKVFYNLWYSSNLMTLAVLGRESLADLEDMVVSLFENVQNKEKAYMKYPFHPWGPDEMMRRLCVVPLNAGLQTMVLHFPLPDLRDHYDSAPENYVKHYLLHTGHNTLISVLQRRDLCKSMQFILSSFGGFAFVKLVFEMTHLGISATDEIINLTFQYIYMLMDNGVEEWMQREMKMSYSRAFQYYNSTPQAPLDYTLMVARDLQKDHPIENILYRKFARFEWNPSAVRYFLSFLRPNNMNITLVTPFCSVFHMIMGQEKHYKTTFMITKVPDDSITKWSTEAPHPGLEFPTPYELMPDRWDNYTRDDDEPWDPYIIHKSSISEIWFMQENTSYPEVFIHLEFFSSIVNYGPAERIFWHLFYGLLKNVLNDHVHIPRFENHKWVSYNIAASNSGMHMKFSGANDKLHLLLEKVLSNIMTDFEDYVSKESFGTLFRQYVNLMRKEMRDNHSFQCEWCILQYLKHDDNWEKENTLDFKKRFPDLKKFLRKLFRRIFIRGLIYGNYTKQKALDIFVNIIEKSFNSSQGLLLKETLRSRLMDPDNRSHRYCQLFNRQHDLYGSAYLFLLGSNEPSPHGTVLSYLLHATIFQLCQEFFIGKIEINSFLGAECMVVQIYPTRELLIQVVSKEASDSIDSKLESFLHHVVPKMIRDLSDVDFLAYKYRLENFFKQTSLQSISNDYWREIVNRSYRFDRGQMEVDLLRALEKTDLLEFVKENLHRSSQRRRTLTVHILPERKQKKQKLISLIPAEATTMENVYSYKTNVALLPHGFKSSGTIMNDDPPETDEIEW